MCIPLLVLAAGVFLPSPDAMGFCLFGCDDYYDYDGPCPPERPSILEYSVHELAMQCLGQECKDVLDGKVDASWWTDWRCDSKADDCISWAQETRDEAARDHMNAKIVCRTAPPPSLQEICRAKNVCGQEIPLNGSCEWYCDNCYAMDPEGGLTPEELKAKLDSAVGDLSSAIDTLKSAIPDFSTFTDVVEDVQEMGKVAVEAVCVSQGASDIDLCVREKLGQVVGLCVQDVTGMFGNINKAMGAYFELDKTLDDIGKTLNGPQEGDPPPAISCDGMDWDYQPWYERVARAACDNLDNLQISFSPAKSAKEFLEGLGKAVTKGPQCIQDWLEDGIAGGVCLVKPDSDACARVKNYRKKIKKNEDELLKKVGLKKKEMYKKISIFESFKKMAKSKLLAVKAACAFGKVGNLAIKCFGLPGGLGKGAKQVCEESHFTCSPLLPPGMTRDDFLPRCDSTY